MRNIVLAALVVTGAATAIAGFGAAASAQSLPDDTRCFLLSNAFAKQATDPKARQIAVAAVTFYLGRLDAKADANAIADSVKREGHSIDPKQSGPMMSACAQRMGRAEQAVQNAIRAQAPAPAPKK